MLTIKPIHLRQANEFVKQYHRHNLPTVGAKFAVACYDDNRLCGVAICGRPTARKLDSVFEYALLYMGNCFRTRAEAESHKDEIMAKYREAMER